MAPRPNPEPPTFRLRLARNFGIILSTMAQDLIITGVGYFDYALAGATAKKALGDGARVVGLSKRKLPQRIVELATGKKRVFILGVSLENDVAALKAALAELKRRKVEVEWLSVIEPELAAKQALEGLVKMTILARDTLEEAAIERFGTQLGELAAEDIAKYEELVSATLFRQRVYGDDKIYGEVVGLLASGIPPSAWGNPILNTVAHYRRFGDRELVGHSEVIKRLKDRIAVVAKHSDARVMILGESGTGKETVAQLIHSLSPRAKRRFIPFNCATFAKDLLESRFFGYEKGAFTGADAVRDGLFKEADGGTLFLDEIGELPLEVQGLLLRVLEGGRFQRVGGTEEISVDVRLITATNRNLPALVREGKFREDLYQRLNVVPIKVPALREHKEDICDIADGWWFGRNGTHLGATQIAALEQYDYPGNVRELINLLERATVLGENDFELLMREHKEMNVGLDAGLWQAATEMREEAPDKLEDAIRMHIRRVYEKCGQNLTRAAAALDVSRNTVRKYL